MEINVGERLKQIRVAKNLTQEELSRHLFLTRQTISKWETGKSLPDIENLILLCRFYGIGLDALIGLDTLSYSASNIQKNNQRKEIFRLLTKQSKLLLASVAGILLLSFSYSFILDRNMQQSLAYADSFLVYRVKDVEYENNHPKATESRGKVKSMTLMTGDKIEELDLKNRLKWGNAMVDHEFNQGVRISKNSLY